MVLKWNKNIESVIEVMEKEKNTWANQSIGWKAVESVENAINNL